MGFDEYIVPGRGDGEDPNAAPPQQKKALEETAVNNMLQSLAQLVDVRCFATEIFTNLQKEAEETVQRMNSVRDRIQKMSHLVAPIEATFHSSSPDCFYSAYANQKLVRDSTPSGGLFIRSNAPKSVERRRYEAWEVPQLNLLNKYAKCLDIGDQDEVNCLDRYTNPRFFLNQWVEAEMERLKKKKKGRRKKKKNPNRKKKGPKTVQALQKTYKNDLGQTIVRKQQTVDLVQGERQMQRGGEMTAVTKAYGTTTDLNQFQQTRNNTGSVYQPQKYDKKQTNFQTGEGAPPMQRPPQANFQQPPPQQYSQPVQPPPMQTPPPGPSPGAMRGPPAGPPSGPPTAPQHTPVQQEAAPQMPEELAPYAKMLRLRVPPPAIKNKMRQNGVDVALFDFWLDPNGPKGKGASSAPPAGPPAGPGAPPAAPRGGLLGQIQQGTQLKAAPTQQQAPRPSPMGNGGLLNAIRAGKSLKKASDRKLAEKKVEVNGRDQLMANLRAGISLKSASSRKLKKKKQDASSDANNIFALMKMRELIQDSDEEDDSDGSWSSD